MIPNQWLTRIIVLLAVVVVCGLGVVAAQQTRDVDSTSSLSALTNEVRLLRQAVEKSSQTQSHVQAMAIYLSAQQNRLNQSSGRAVSLRNQLTMHTNQLQEATDRLGNFQRMLTTGRFAGGNDERNNLENVVAETKSEIARITRQQSETGARLAEADAVVQNDLARWTEMITRLEQLTRP